MTREQKPTHQRRPAGGTKGKRGSEATVLPRRCYRGVPGATIGDLPENAAFDRGSRVVK